MVRLGGRKKKNEVPLGVAVFVIILAGVALQFPVFLGDQIAQTNIASSGAQAGDGLGGDRAAGAQFAIIKGPATGIGAASCSDTDASAGHPGQLGVKGTCTSQPANISKTDYCWDNVSVVEFSCRASRCVQNIFNCLNYGYNSCVDGACVNTSLPDLAITSFTYNITSVVANITNFTITGVIQNIGSVTAGNSTTTLSITQTGSGSGGIISFATPSLPPGAEFGIKHDLTLTGPALVNMTLVADSGSMVVESDETNNVATLSFTV